MNRLTFVRSILASAAAAVFPWTAKPAGAQQAMGYLETGFRFPLCQPMLGRPGKSGVVESIRYSGPEHMTVTLRMVDDVDQPTIPPTDGIYTNGIVIRKEMLDRMPAAERERYVFDMLWYQAEQAVAVYNGMQVP